MSRVVLESWEVRESELVTVPDEEHVLPLGRVYMNIPGAAGRATLVAAAPDLASVLVRIEWSAVVGWRDVCPICTGIKPRHREGCDLDNALSRAGLVSDTERNQLRVLLG